jgi:NAD(P)-dependent dehydrogenase (short-subunit alcohol dehydrogenase family)
MKCRTVVITGASRGLGLASATELYRRGWRVVAAMRSVETGLARLREVSGARVDDPRMIGVPLNLIDPESVAAAGKMILDTVGAPFALVHNAGVAVAGFVEETPAAEWHRLFATNLFGPAALTNVLLPAMRDQGEGRIVVVSSTGAVRGMPLASIYSATKAGVERWAESLAAEIAPYGLGVTILLAGTYDTEITGDATPVYLDESGPYSPQHPRMEKRGRLAMRLANPPERFARSLAKALEHDRRPIVHRGAGVDAKVFRVIGRLMPSIAMHHMVRIGLGQPRFGALRTQNARTSKGQNGYGKWA